MRRLWSVLLLAGLLAMQGASLSHAHEAATDHESCVVCRVADEAAHAIEAIAVASPVLHAPTSASEAPMVASASDAVSTSQAPRAPPAA